ncbi:MAG: dihydrodipicolinate synthase family protein [Tepidisphaeraceae bacterium]
MPSKYTGVVVPMLSPFTPGGSIDEPAVGRIVDRLLTGKPAGIFPLGTTGESASISQSEKKKLIATTVKAVAGRAMNYAGISANVFTDSLELAQVAKDNGVDAVVAHVPSYFGLTDADIEAYYLKLADAVPLPLVLYNIPPTTHHSIALDVVGRLIQHPNVVAIKDSAGDADRLTKLLALTGGRGGFPVLLGSSAFFTHGLKAGGVGLIPSGSHIAPVEYGQMFEAAMRDDWAEVERLQTVTDAAVSAYVKGRTIGEGLARLKKILSTQNICGPTMLPPLRDNVEAV